MYNPKTYPPGTCMKEFVAERVEYALDNYNALHFDCFCSIGWWFYRKRKTDSCGMVIRAMYDMASTPDSRATVFINQQSKLENYPDDLSIFK